MESFVLVLILGILIFITIKKPRVVKEEVKEIKFVSHSLQDILLELKYFVLNITIPVVNNKYIESKEDSHGYKECIKEIVNMRSSFNVGLITRIRVMMSPTFIQKIGLYFDIEKETHLIELISEIVENYSTSIVSRHRRFEIEVLNKNKENIVKNLPTLVESEYVYSQMIISMQEELVKIGSK